MRYVNKEGYPVQRFLEFIPISSHDAETMKNTMLQGLKEANIDIKNCRGQCYDNASNMSGIQNGLQAKIKDLNKKACFLPCDDHSLNLIVKFAAECCLYATQYFMLLQRLYTFLSASTSRWRVVTEFFKKSTASQTNSENLENSDDEDLIDDSIITEPEPHESTRNKTFKDIYQKL